MEANTSGVPEEEKGESEIERSLGTVHGKIIGAKIVILARKNGKYEESVAPFLQDLTEQKLADIIGRVKKKAGDIAWFIRDGNVYKTKLELNGRKSFPFNEENDVTVVEAGKTAMLIVISEKEIDIKDNKTIEKLKSIAAVISKQLLERSSPQAS